MTTIEKVAYLKGLMEGMKVEETGDNGKLLTLIAGILEELAKELADLQAFTEELSEQVDAVDEDLNAVEEDFYDAWDDDDCGCGCGCGCGDGEEEYFDVTCPSCGEEFEVDEDTLLDGGVACPCCGEHLEFDFDDDDDAEDEE